jgi:hypothetical protein
LASLRDRQKSAGLWRDRGSPHIAAKQFMAPVKAPENNSDLLLYNDGKHLLLLFPHFNRIAIAGK